MPMATSGRFIIVSARRANITKTVNFSVCHHSMTFCSAQPASRTGYMSCRCLFWWSTYETSASVTDWCISPHGIAGPQNQSSPNSEKKCSLARPITVQNLVAIRQLVSNISAIENLCSPKWAKVHQNRLRPATPKAPPSCQISSRSVKPPWRKALQNFTPFNILALQGNLLGQRSPVWVVGYINPPLATCKISSRSEISAAKLCRFCCRRDPQTYSKRYVSALHAETFDYTMYK